MPEIKIPLHDSLVNYLQALMYETDGLKVLHTHALNAGLSKEKTEEIRRRYLDVYAEYQLAKAELWGPYDKEYPKCRWWLDFQEGVLHIVTAQQQA